MLLIYIKVISDQFCFNCSFDEMKSGRNVMVYPWAELGECTRGNLKTALVSDDVTCVRWRKCKWRSVIDLCLCVWCSHRNMSSCLHRTSRACEQIQTKIREVVFMDKNHQNYNKTFLQFQSVDILEGPQKFEVKAVVYICITGHYTDTVRKKIIPIRSYKNVY